MQIVIDILEQDYEKVVDGRRIPVARMRNAIRNGTPLPKGHGRIVDISKMQYIKTLNEAIHGRLPWAEAIRRIKNSAPTIVEAESEDKE